MTDYGTRADCVRDNRATTLPNSSFLGFSTNKAKRGNWITYEIDNHCRAARVVGGVTCEGKRYLEVITWDVAQTMAYVRWIEPASVRSCYPRPPAPVLAFLSGQWDDWQTILATAASGKPGADLCRLNLGMES